MGVGITAMHYIGMAAIRIVPMIRYEPVLVAASIAIAITGSFAALLLAFHLRFGQSRTILLARFAAAIVMGLAISGMHYTAMTASIFGLRSFCRGGVLLNNEWLSITIAAIALGLLAVTLITEMFDAHLTAATRVNARRLEQVNAELHHQATHDALTGLPNRTLLIDRLKQALTQAERYGGRFAVMVLDLDRFKIINDSLGHAAGDELLVEISRRLTGAVRKIDTVARVGGDEFLLIVNDVREREEASGVARKILEVTSQPCRAAGVEVQSSPSIGLSLYPEHGIDSDILLAHADEAMYCAKQRGGNKLSVFRARHERLRARTPGTRIGPATGACPAPVRALLPAEGGCDERARGECRGTPALASSEQGHDCTGCVHRPGRADRPHRSHRRLGASGGVPSGPRVADGGAAPDSRRGQSIGDPVSQSASADRDSRGPR
jgi:diguanylate cyclase (GGDEF)-like protein